MVNKERFLSILKTVQRKGINDLISYLESTSFFSDNKDFNETSDHCLQVYDLMMMLNKLLDARINQESLIIVSLLHDVCKIKEEAQFICGHGEKSVFILQRYINLTNEEIMAINTHLGEDDLRATDYKGFSECFDKFPICLLLHCADTLAASYLCYKDCNITKRFEMLSTILESIE